ncbi:hypothetical protein ACER0C_007338 [Sarotherodon galilaeus]
MTTLPIAFRFCVKQKNNNNKIFRKYTNLFILREHDIMEFLTWSKVKVSNPQPPTNGLLHVGVKGKLYLHSLTHSRFLKFLGTMTRPCTVTSCQLLRKGSWCYLSLRNTAESQVLTGHMYLVIVICAFWVLQQCHPHPFLYLPLSVGLPLWLHGPEVNIFLGTLTSICKRLLTGYLFDSNLVGMTEAITLLILAVQTGLIELQVIHRAFLLSIVLFIVAASILQSMLEIADPIPAINLTAFSYAGFAARPVGVCGSTSVQFLSVSSC